MYILFDFITNILTAVYIFISLGASWQIVSRPDHIPWLTSPAIPTILQIVSVTTMSLRNNATATT